MVYWSLYRMSCCHSRNDRKQLLKGNFNVDLFWAFNEHLCLILSHSTYESGNSGKTKTVVWRRNRKIAGQILRSLCESGRVADQHKFSERYFSSVGQTVTDMRSRLFAYSVEPLEIGNAAWTNIDVCQT